MPDPTPASGKDESDYRIIDGIEYVKVSRVKMFIAIANHQAVQKAVYGFHEYMMGKNLIQLETDQAYNYARLHHAIDNYIAELTAAQAWKDERSAAEEDIILKQPYDSVTISSVSSVTHEIYKPEFVDEEDNPTNATKGEDV